MHDLALNGNNSDTTSTKQGLQHDTPPKADTDDKIEELDTATPYDLNGHEDTDPTEPPSKRRKIAAEVESQTSSPRPPSPPWKKFSAEGPTSYVENGRRKSGRTNLIPLGHQPHSNRRQTRAAYDRIVEQRTQPISDIKSKSKNKSNGKIKSEIGKPKSVDTALPPKRGPGRPPKLKREFPVPQARTVVPPRTRRQQAGRVTRRRSSHVPVSTDDEELSEVPFDISASPSLDSTPLLTLQKVKFRVALPKPAVTTPANICNLKKYTSFEDFLDNDPQEPYTGQDLLTSRQVRREALARHRVYEARDDGRFDTQSAQGLLGDRQTELPRQYAHFDHLLSHVSHFRGLLRQEQKDHRKKAEQLAHEAKRFLEEKRKKGRVKTAEEIEQEQVEMNRVLYRKVCKDLEKLWLSVEAEVNVIRLRQYEEEQQAKIKGHLNRVLERTDQMLQRHEDSEIASDMDSDVDETDSNSSESNSEDLSASDSESDIEIEADPDAGLTAEELRAKYENVPQLEDADTTDQAGDIEGSEEDSDPETDMDSEFDTEGSDDMAESEDEESDGDENGSGGLMSLLFSKKQIAEMSSKHEEDEAPQESASVAIDQPAIIDGEERSPLIEELEDDVEIDQIAVVENQTPQESSIAAPTLNQPSLSMELSVQTSPQTSATKVSESDSASSVELHTQNQTFDTMQESKSTIKTPIPVLLRGTLREYQHEGLDWLANLYASGRNGILADEMGLGKTIQSISLLAHLATEYEVWGPHLIVVPTSVMLNWEMEFKKFLPGFKILTYYGSLDERKQKRRGWMADDSFNVCITSYQLVLQDANSFKRRRWHCMILDEAHNIKNFRSERWQTMMTFNTRARLLLTGTPLQNNLTELWSLLFFLHYGQEGQDNDDAFAGLQEWSEWFKKPVESILEHGRQVLDEEDREQVSKLHKVIRPYLLRRLKADVEKQMPAKYEHVELCRLSKRQRQLYDGFMSRAQTKETLASGNYLSIINALMQLRKVCNHPDLFETRPINTSFTMPKSVAVDFEIKDLLIRRKIFGTGPLDKVDLDFLQLVPISNERISVIENLETLRRHAYGPIKALRDSQWSRINRSAVVSGSSCAEVVAALDNIGRKERLRDLDRTVYYEAYRHHQRPIYGRELLKKLTIMPVYEQISRLSQNSSLTNSWEKHSPLARLDLVQSVQTRSNGIRSLLEHYACLTPAVMAMDLNQALYSDRTAKTLRRDLAQYPDPFHQVRMKLSIAFPDKRLLQYDCGKLQRLDKLLRRLQAGGHRALIFTQMTKVLDVLEQFLNIHGHRYLRLDGATKVEQRQILTDRFNNDTRILAFILSSRSGGLGINLTGADTVIFYDLDWNPAMDRQCTDRAHRIGQTRDVHIYRFVSEHTIESNILRKANQKQMLDDVVIQEGDFTTDYLNKVTYQDMLDDTTEDDVAGAAMDRVLGNDKTAVAVFEQAEDKEDASAAKVATKEIQHADDGDFEDKVATTPQNNDSGTPGPFGPTNLTIAEVDDGEIHHIDEYLMKLQTYLLKDVPLLHRRDKMKRGKKKDDQRRRRAR